MGNIPLEVALPVAGGLVAAIGALWAKLSRTETKLDAANEKIQSEIRRGAELALMPRKAEDPPPASLPPPDWEETTEHRRVRSRLEQEVLTKALREYVERERTPTDYRKKLPSVRKE